MIAWETSRRSFSRKTSLEQDMLQQGIPLFGTALNERDAFRAIFSFGGTLSDLDPSAVEAARGARAPGGGCIMSGARPNIFDDIDLSGFAPKSEGEAPPSSEIVHRVSEEGGFPSRAPRSHAPAPPPASPRRLAAAKTGRTVLLNALWRRLSAR
jgi:hypothetical protein